MTRIKTMIPGMTIVAPTGSIVESNAVIWTPFLGLRPASTRPRPCQPPQKTETPRRSGASQGYREERYVSMGGRSAVSGARGDAEPRRRGQRHLKCAKADQKDSCGPLTGAGRDRQSGDQGDRREEVIESCVRG